MTGPAGTGIDIGKQSLQSGSKQMAKEPLIQQAPTEAGTYDFQCPNGQCTGWGPDDILFAPGMRVEKQFLYGAANGAGKAAVESSIKDVINP